MKKHFKSQFICFLKALNSLEAERRRLPGDGVEVKQHREELAARYGGIPSQVISVQLNHCPACPVSAT